MSSVPQSNGGASPDLAPAAPGGVGVLLVVLSLLLCGFAFIAAALFDARIAVGVIGLLLFAIATLRAPYFGLLLYIVVLYVRPGEMGLIPASLHFERLVALGLMGVVFLQALLGRGKGLPANALNRVMVCFVLVAWMGVPFAFWKGGAASGAFEFTKLGLLYFGVVYLADNVRRVRTLVWVALVLWSWYAFWAVVGYATGSSVYQGENHLTRALGPTVRFGDADTLANLLACAASYAGLLLLSLRGRGARLVLGVMLLLFVAGVVVTGSRTGFLGLAFVALLVALTSRHRVLALALFLFLLVGAWLATPQDLQERYRSIKQYQSQTTWMTRRDTWLIGLRMFAEHPLFGVGYGDFGAARHELYDGAWLAPHSVYIQVSAELGLAGVICFLFLIGYVVRENRRLRRALRARAPDADTSFAITLSLAIEIHLWALLFVGITGHNLSNPGYYLVAALTVCLARYAQTVPAEAKPVPAAG